MVGAKDQRNLFVPAHSDKDLHGVGGEKQSAGDSAVDEETAFQRND